MIADPATQQINSVWPSELTIDSTVAIKWTKSLEYENKKKIKSIKTWYELKYLKTNHR